MGAKGRTVIESISSNIFVTGAVIVLCAYRIVRLLIHDAVLGRYPASTTNPVTGEQEPVPGDRGTFIRRWVDLALYDANGVAHNALTRWLGELSTCPACVSAYVSPVVLVAWVVGPVWLQWAVLAGAVSGAVTYISTRPGA